MSVNAVQPKRYAISLVEFTIAFVPFCLFLGSALLVGDQQLDVSLGYTVFTIWATIALVTPALCAFALPGQSARKQAVWILFWTFALIAYLVHLYYAVFWFYEGSFAEFIAGQGWFAAVNNVIFTLWWILDVLLAWFYRVDLAWIRIERILAHWYIGLTFVVASVFLRHGFVNVLGVLMTVAIVICLIIRIDNRHPAASV